RIHDLASLATRVRETYFEGDYGELPIYWSKKQARGYWGKYYSDPPRIVINRKLDSPDVPDFVVESVLHHEMLHHHLGVPIVNGRRRAHTPLFRRLERSFPQFGEAERFLARYEAPMRGPSKLVRT